MSTLLALALLTFGPVLLVVAGCVIQVRFEQRAPFLQAALRPHQRSVIPGLAHPAH